MRRGSPETRDGEQMTQQTAVRWGNTTAAGCWDVFSWRNGRVLFAESKWKDNDAIRNSQREWLQAALAGKLTSDNFLIVEWKISG